MKINWKWIRLVLISLVAIITIYLFIDDVFLTGSTFFPLNFILLFQCIFSVIGIVCAIRDKSKSYYYILGGTILLYLLYRNYPSWFLIWGHNIKYINKINLGIIGIIACFTILIILNISKDGQNSNDSETDNLFTQDKYSEAEHVILEFEKNWFCEDMYNDPYPYIEKYLTEPSYSYYLGKLDDTEKWEKIIPRIVSVRNLHIMEYEKTKMVIVACIDIGTNEIDESGTVINENEVRNVKKLYYFKYVDSSWKLMKSFGIANPEAALHEWTYLPESSKALIGPIDSYVYKSCTIEK